MKKSIILFLISVLFIPACGFGAKNSVRIGDKMVAVEIAKSDEEKSTGLMWREYLEEDTGMLFIWEDQKQRSFWMRNTLIPLDIIFIGKDKKIINIEIAEPCKKKVCDSYKSEKPAQYVLEVDKGWSEKNDIKPGISVDFNLANN